MVVAYLCGILTGILASILMLFLYSVSRTPKKESPAFDFKTLFRKPEPEPPRDYAQTSIPRTKGSWRRQMRDLQAQHNTKQKERDAMFAPQLKSEKSNASTR